MPHGPYYLELPADGSGLRYVDEISWNRLVGGIATWQGDVNGGGYKLTNVLIDLSDIGGVPETRQIIAGPGLTGGGPLSADVTLSVSLTAGQIGAAQTPWLQNIDGGGFTLSNVSRMDTGGFRSSGGNVASSGFGVEVLVGGGPTGYIQSFDRSASQFFTLQIEAVPIVINAASNGRVQIGPNLGGATGVLDIYRNTGVENFLRVHHGNVYDIQYGIDSVGNAYAAYSSNITNVMFYGTGAAGQVWIQTNGANRITIDSAGKITMGNSSSDAVQLNGRTYANANNEQYSLGVRYSASNAVMWLGADASGNFAISEAGGLTKFVVAQNGNVGIGVPTTGARHKFRLTDAGGETLLLYGQSGSVYINAINSALTNQMPLIFAASRYTFIGIPGSNPGAGGGMWYDPADGNRMKYAP